MIKCRFVFFFVALSILIPAGTLFGQAGHRSLPPEELVPPPQPAVRPIIATLGPNDTDLNKIDDILDDRLSAARKLMEPVERTQALAETVRVELVFTEQITQDQINTFTALGGVIDHIYQSVSYGWNGRIAIGQLEQVTSLMGGNLAAVVGEHKSELHLKEATQNGRVRPVWVSGFAGSVSGFSGNSNITIAVIDSGVDDSHTDLSGRNEYWNDYTTDAEATPRDIIQHGSHVTGIALGTGAAIGASPAQVLFTDSGSLSGAGAGGFYASPFHVPAGAATFNSTATWLGGGSTTLYRVWQNEPTAGWNGADSATGSSPLTRNSSFTALSTRHYSAALLQNGPPSTITDYAVVNTATASGVGDGYNALRGVAPSCRWAGAKVFTNAGSGSGTDINEAVDDMVTQRATHNIKVVNMSLGITGDPGLSTTLRAKVNTMVNNGIVAVTSAGNDGPGTANANLVDDPGRAALALTVAASNSVNALTEYTSSGFLSPGASEDYKPDVMAPGGSDYYAYILSVDSNDADAESTSFADRQSNDYYNISGTSMSSPFAAGAAALVIDALQQKGVTWNFTSSAHPLLVKMLLCATATESNANREAGGSDPTLGRAATPKDRFEGYGMINPDAAIEAVMLQYTGTSISDSTNGGYYDRRAWARYSSLTAGNRAVLSLTVPATADYDLYLYSATPDSKGNPVIRASSTNAGLGTDESIDYTASTTEGCYLVVKRVSGNGTWTLNGPTLAIITSLKATIVGLTEVDVEWKTQSERDVLGFNVWRSTDRSGDYTKLNGDLIEATGSAHQGATYLFKDTTIVSSETYYYKVEAVNETGPSEWAGPVKAVEPGQCEDPPGAPVLTSPANRGRTRTQVTLRWQSPSCAEGFDLVVREGSRRGKIFAEANGLTGTDYELKGLSRRVTYYWRVTAYNEHGRTRSKMQRFTVR